MSEKVVIVGGVALGPKVACRIKRLAPDFHVTVIDQDCFISYGGCGIPYYVGGDVADLEGLQSTSAHVLRDADFFKNAKGVEIQTQCEVKSIDRESKTLKVMQLTDSKEQMLPYDRLVLATGAQPVLPPIPGSNLPGVTVVSNLTHAKTIKDNLSQGKVGRAVVIGAGAIGLEMAEALTDLWGIETTLIEMQPQVLPAAVGADMAVLAKNHLEEKSVRVLLSEKVTRIIGTPETGVSAVETDKDRLPCDLVVIAVGVRPNTSLAAAAGLKIGKMGGIIVDDFLRTSDPHIYAGGDCIELKHLLTGDQIHMPMGSLANRQGRVIGTNITGGEQRFKGTLGAFCLKIFEMGIFRTGLTVQQAKSAGYEPVHTVVAQADRAHFYPTQQMMVLKLIADRKSRCVLGAEAIGPNGDAVKARIDAVSALLPHKPVLQDLSNLEISYSPPFGSAMDILNSAANTLENIIEGRHQPVDVIDFLTAFKTDQAQVLDVRSQVQADPLVKKYGDRWQNIPQEDLACRIDEVQDAAPLYLICGAGPRSYEAQLLLRRKGIKETKNVQGGMKMLKSTDPTFSS